VEPITLPSSKQVSVLQQVWTSPLYRGATIALFLSGLGTSDRKQARLFRLCAFAGFIGWGGFALSNWIWMPFLLGTLVLPFSNAAGSQLFAAVRDSLDRSAINSDESVVAVVRMALTAGWVVGPVVGNWFAAGFGLRAMLWGTALCSLAQILPLIKLRLSVKQFAVKNPVDSELPGSSRWRTMLPLLIFTGLYVFVYAGESIKYGFLPLYMDEKLKLDPWVRGAVIGIQPLVELVLMPFSVVYGRRIGMLWLMCIGATLGVAANLCFATIGNAIGMFVGQILMGGVWGIFAALGIIVAQRLLPTGIATASAIFISSSAVSSALGESPAGSA
jgi:MFS transporter, SET family, sugar efflux transporter